MSDDHQPRCPYCGSTRIDIPAAGLVMCADCGLEWDLRNVPRMWWKPATDDGPACLSIEVDGGPKIYRRIWSPGTPAEILEWGWVLADTAVPLHPEVTV